MTTNESSSLARGSLAFLGIASMAAVGLALAVPDLTAGSGMAGMAMTHYMELLAVRQPWNLLLFMALPVILAETLAITELVMHWDAPDGPRGGALDHEWGMARPG